MKFELSPAVRYWELGSKDILSQLTRIQEKGYKTVAAWVPWSHLESDRHHLLQKFLKQAHTCGLKVRLGVTPELSIGYPSGGVPDDLLRDPQNLAQDRMGQLIHACAPPNIHPLVSLVAPAVFQRYGHFLLKLVQVLTDVAQEGFPVEIELVVSDSLFKHYRNTGLAPEDFGDYSRRHSQAQQRGEQWTPVAAEQVFLNRAFDFLRSRLARFAQISVVRRNLGARSVAMDRLVEELAGGQINRGQWFADLQRQRASAEFLWLDDLSSLSDRERNFFISAALVYYGDVWVAAEDFFASSDGFLRKMKGLTENFTTDDVSPGRQVYTVVGNRFAPARIAEFFRARLGASVKFVVSLAEVAEKASAKLLVVEEGLALNAEEGDSLVKLAREHSCTVVFFRSSLAGRTLRMLSEMKGLKLSHGWNFDLHVFSSGGNVIVVEGGGPGASIEALGENLLAVAQVEPWCKFDRESHELATVSYEWRTNPHLNEQTRTMFLLNPGREPLALRLDFLRPASVQGIHSGARDDERESRGTSFNTTLPPFSVVPVAITMDAPLATNQVDHDGSTAELA